MKKSISILFFLGIFLSISIASGPWPQVKGKGYFKLSEWWVVFDKHYTDSGNTDPNITTGIFNTFFYGEYGLSNKTTAIINLPIISRNYVNNLVSETTNEILIPGEGITSIGDIDLGIKYRLSNANSIIPISLTLIVGIPIGKTAAGDLENLQTGDGEFNQIIQFDTGWSFNIGATNGYVSSYLGVNNRSRGFSEELRYGAEIGFGLLNNKLWVNSKLTAVESFKNGQSSELLSFASIYTNNTEYVSLGLEINYYLKNNIGISVGTSSALHGEVIAAAPSYSFGFFYDLK